MLSIHPLLKRAKLLNETNSYFKILPPRIEKLQSLKQWPFVLLHEVGSNNAASSTLAPYTVNKDALSLRTRTFDEIEDLVSNFVVCVEKYLVFTVYPVESQIYNSYVLPVVAQLSATAVDDTRHLVWKHKF